jgi:hypothetical protein
MKQIMMCTPYISRELWIFKIIIIYEFFIEFISNEKIAEDDEAVDDAYSIHV